ncbi:unnamed protein product [Paramecium octaurelia]|uniref:Uncharacterized protein n=1 Tax=Paramecium octaurelia TaxID=43137 RepID=A0A8S1W507_PAROT|nr:unnamed protein product [Paramecium octaurelia]
MEQKLQANKNRQQQLLRMLMFEFCFISLVKMLKLMVSEITFDELQLKIKIIQLTLQNQMLGLQKTIRIQSFVLKTFNFLLNLVLAQQSFDFNN